MGALPLFDLDLDLERREDVLIPCESATRIVIIDPAFVGDVVFDAPLVRWLRARRPAAHLGLVVRPPAEGVARRVAGLDAVHVYDKRGADRGFRGLRRVARVLADARYDVALIPHPSVRSVLLARAARIPRRVGIGQAWVARRGLTNALRLVPGDTFVGDRMRLGAWLLGLSAEDVEPRGDVALTKISPASEDLAGALAAKVARRADVSPQRAQVGLVLGSNWATKRWPVENAARLILRLHQSGVSTVLLGSDAERTLVSAMERACPEVRGLTVDGMGGTLEMLIDRIAACDAFVAGDTGPLHIARALGVPVVALFGPTPEGRHRFLARDIVLTNPMDCRPCSKHGDTRCPLGHHRCLRDLSSDVVFAAVHEVLDRSDRRRGHGEIE
ncbi:MAG: glycosyltransferase family 9 protein [Deltaproteobacteria bacterium]|nr:glycosyltransferase family 9 protein [Deltaproteobacteria bacterium]